MRNTKGRGSGPRLSILKKLEIIEKYQSDDPPTKISLARKYDVTEKSIRYILSNSEEIKKRVSNMQIARRNTTSNSHQPKYPELEETLVEWIKSERCKNEPAPMNIIEKAKQVAATLGESYVSFKASWGWYHKFKLRNGLGPLLPEDVNIPETIVPEVSPIDNFYDIIMRYEPEYIYCMSETGLFNCLLPQYNVIFPEEDVSLTSSNKTFYNRVTLAICCNSTGLDRIPITMFSKAKSPSYTRGNHWPIPYYYQEHALLDRKTFEKWFNDVFHEHVRQKTDEKALLILDNNSVYQKEFEKNNIRVIPLPSGLSYLKQPLNMGIITALKNKYKYLLLKKVLFFYNLPHEAKEQQLAEASKMKKTAVGIEFGKPAHLLDAAKICFAAWSDLSTDLIKNSFQKANIGIQFRPNNPHELEIEERQFVQEKSQLINEIYEMLQNSYLPNLVHQDKSVVLSEIENFLHLDDKESTFYQQCVKEDVDNPSGD